MRLTSKEFRILELLSLHRDGALGQDAILDDLYPDADHRPDVRIIDVFVAMLRKKLARASRRTDCSRIVAVGGQGFRLVDPDEGAS